MSEPAHGRKMTLWALTLTWPCDYAQIERRPVKKNLMSEPAEITSKAPFTTISVHLDGCRRCVMQKNLLHHDELLRRTAETTYEAFAQIVREHGDEPISEEQFEAIREHAQVVRDEMLGCPKA